MASRAIRGTHTNKAFFASCILRSCVADSVLQRSRLPGPSSSPAALLLKSLPLNLAKTYPELDSASDYHPGAQPRTTSVPDHQPLRTLRSSILNIKTLNQIPPEIAIQLRNLVTGSVPSVGAFGIVNPDRSFAQNWNIVIIPDCATPPSSLGPYSRTKKQPLPRTLP